MSKAAVKRAFVMDSVWQFRFIPEQHNGTGAEIIPCFRQVVHVQSNAVAFAKDPTPEGIAAAKAKPHRLATWLYFDSKGAEEVHEVTLDGDVRIVNGSGTLLEYRRVP